VILSRDQTLFSSSSD